MLLVVLVATVVVVVAGGIGAQSLRGDASRAGRVTSHAPIASAVAGLPQPPRPAFTVGRPVLLDRDESVSRHAPVLGEVSARRLPRWDAPPVALLGRETPEATTNIVLVLHEARIAGRTWVHARVPVLPNHTTAWLPRDALGGYRFVTTRLVVDRARLRATLLRGGRPVFQAPVGIGRDAWPTPRGEFYVRDRVSGFGNPFYGPIAFGTSARSAVLTDWPGGGFIGIHGTNEPGLIPGRISHGCIRLRNEDIVRLARLMPVGTPLTII